MSPFDECSRASDSSINHIGFRSQFSGKGRQVVGDKSLKKDMTFLAAVAKVIRSLRGRGVASTVHSSLFQLRDLWFDWRNGVDTWGVVSMQNMDLNGVEQTHALHYEPTPVPVIEEVFEALRELGLCFEQFIFVDLGSGKGRTLLQAARLPFKKVVGVEISQALHSAAVRNVLKSKTSTKSIGSIECVRADAANFKIPAGNTVIYLYHPFDKHVLEQVLENLRVSLQVSRSMAYVVYVYPSLSDVIRLKGFLSKVLDRRASTAMNAYEEGSTYAAPFEIWRACLL